MKTFRRLVGLGFLAVLASLPASAATISLFEYAFNIDGTISNGSVPAGVTVGPGFAGTGLGTVTVRVAGAGSHYVALFVDHEIDEETNTFFNERGSVSGVSAAGQSWEIDEPGYTFGDIYGHFAAGSLDNGNGVPAGAEDDVSMAMGWDFLLDAGQVATLTFALSEVNLGGGGFYLLQSDPDSGGEVYLTGTLDIRDGQAPEPATLALVGLGLFAGWRARRTRPA